MSEKVTAYGSSGRADNREMGDNTGIDVPSGGFACHSGETRSKAVQ